MQQRVYTTIQQRAKDMEVTSRLLGQQRANPILEHLARCTRLAARPRALHRIRHLHRVGGREWLWEREPPLMVYNTYTMRRHQIYLDDKQVAQLKAAAKTSARSVSEIIRDAIGEKLARAEETDDFERALVAAAGIWARRADIGSTEEYVRKLRRDRRGAEAS